MTGVILFRAQPFHNGHLHMIKKAFDDCRETNSDLYIFVGSADKAGTKRNPLPISLRLQLIADSLKEFYNEEDYKKIHLIPLKDLTDERDNSHSWGRYLFMKMLQHTRDIDMTIYYCDKPEIMLSWFDEDDRWCLRFKFLERHEQISATMVRELILKEDYYTLEYVVPPAVYRKIELIKDLLEVVENG